MEVTNRGTQLVTLTCDFPVKWIKKIRKQPIRSLHEAFDTLHYVSLDEQCCQPFKGSD